MPFPGGSDGKAPAYNAGDPGSALGSEEPLEKEIATLSSILTWRIPWTEELVGHSPRGHKESDTAEQLHFTFLLVVITLSSGIGQLLLHNQLSQSSMI